MAVFAFLATIATLTAWLWNDGRGESAGHSVVAKTLSAPALRLPADWSSAQRRSLNAALSEAFAPALEGAQSWSLAIVGAGGQIVYENRADHAVAPASVQKLIVAASALNELGPNFRYHTIFAASQGLDDGTLDGDLWLVGSGDPSLQSTDLRNGVAMLARSGLQRIDGGLIVDASAMRGPALNPHWNPDDYGQDYAAPTSAISVDGDTIQSYQPVGGVDQAVWTPMEDVAASVASQAETILRRRGIRVDAGPKVGVAPMDTLVLWDHKSLPLRALETHMLVVSDNHYAEQLLRTVGGEVSGSADDAGGLLAEQRFLAREGVPLPGLRLFDGSGLSPSNRVAAITVARLLALDEPALYRLLPLGGREGTLADYDFTTALGRVRAKSGHLSNVSALAGYASTIHHGRVAFAFLIDGSPADPDAAIVRAVNRLVEF